MAHEFDDFEVARVEEQDTADGQYVADYVDAQRGYVDNYRTVMIRECIICVVYGPSDVRAVKEKQYEAKLATLLPKGLLVIGQAIQLG